jgi:hypothetical protein
MDKVIEIFKKNKWYTNEFINKNFLGKIMRLYNFPNEYLQFMEWSNGGEGHIGENYLYLWKIENVEQLNKDYNIQKYLGINCFGFGTDGGDKCYCFDNKNGENIIKCGLGDLDYNEIKVIANTFFEFIGKLDEEYIE